MRWRKPDSKRLVRSGLNGILKPSVEASLRCPFPDCGDRQARCTELSDGVYLCEQCGRLSHRCVHTNCRSLCRPFSRFCRQCGRTQSEENESPGEVRWSAFLQFDRPWRFPNSESIPDEPQTVLDLQQIEGYLSPQGLLAFTWIDGMLALHQAGGFAAIVHPFAEKAKHHGHSPLCWSALDPYRVRNSRELNEIRAYPPLVTHDRKFVLFSSPNSCFGVTTSALPGWGVSGQAESFVVLDDRLLAEDELAAPPVSLSLASGEDVSSAPCRIGCLLRLGRSSGLSVASYRDQRDTNKSSLRNSITFGRLSSRRYSWHTLQFSSSRHPKGIGGGGGERHTARIRTLLVEVWENTLRIPNCS